MSQLPYAHGGPSLTGHLRAIPEDFQVMEVLGYTADGEGEHVLLEVEKRGVNTAWLAGELARFASVKPMAVGYAGLKDRHAVTRQAFSVQLAGREEPDWSAFPHEGVRVLSSMRHRRKLKRGALEANDFVLVVRDVQGDHKQAEQVLATIVERGVPNYFGEQRFGHGGANVERARAMFAGRRVDRGTRSILLSAARSQIFNEVLATRVRDGNWDRAIDGEVWCLAGSHARFGPEALTDTLRQRLAEGDIHPSGPLWGRGDLPTQAQAQQLEQDAATTWRDLATGLEQAGLEQDRRPLRLVPRHLRWRWLDGTSLEVSFRLPPGTYATVLVRELIAAPQQASIS